MGAPFAFTLPAELSAKEPPERRGIRRDQVRLLVIERATGKIEHTRFDKIDSYLRQKDILVFNSSRTLPASLRGCSCGARHGPCMEVRLAEHLPDDSWLALLLCEQGDPFGCGLREGMQIEFAEGLTAAVLARDANIPRLWKLHFSISGTQLVDLIYRLGKPIRYEYVSAPWDLDYYQTVYAKEPGSAEMPSAGRAFTWKLLLDLSGAVSTAPTSFCTPDFLPTWTTNLIAPIPLQRKNISSAESPLKRSIRHASMAAALSQSARRSCVHSNQLPIRMAA